MAKNDIYIEREYFSEKQPKLTIEPALYIGRITYRVGRQTIGHIVTPANWDPNGRVAVVEQRMNPLEQQGSIGTPLPPAEILDKIMNPALLEVESDETKKFLFALDSSQALLTRGYGKISEALRHLTLPDEKRRFRDYGFSLETSTYRDLILSMHHQLQFLPSR